MDYHIPGDDVHHRRPSPSPHRERSSSARRSTSRARDDSRLRQPTFDDAIAEEPADAQLNGEAEEEEAEESVEGEAAKAATQEAEPGVLVSRTTEVDVEAEEEGEEEEEEEEEDEVERMARGSRSARRGGGVGRRRESTRASLRRKAAEALSRARAFLSPASGPQEDGTAEQKEGEEESGETEEADDAADTGELTEEQGENSQPEGTPAKPRRRPSRRTSAIHAPAQQKQQSAESEPAVQVGDSVRPSSLPVLLSLATIALLLLLASPFLLPRLLEGRSSLTHHTSSGSHSTDSLTQRQYHADRERLLYQLRTEHEKELTKTTASLTQRLEKWGKEGQADLSQLRVDVERQLNEAVSSLSQQVGQTISTRIGAAAGKEKQEREADVEKLRLQLLHEGKVNIDKAVEDSTARVMQAVKEELKERTAKEGQSGSALSERVAAQLQDMEERVLAELLSSVEKRYATREHVAKVDEEVRRYIQQAIAGLPLQAEGERVDRAELQAVEQRLMGAMEQRVEEAKKAMAARGLSEEDRAAITADILSAVRQEVAALHQQHRAQVEDLVLSSVTQAAGQAAAEQHSQAINSLARELGQLRTQVEAGGGPAATSDLHAYVDEQVTRILSQVRGGGGGEETMRKLNALESMIHSIRDASPSPSNPSHLLSLILDVLTQHAASLYPSLSTHVHHDISTALELYSADRTGLVDYALKSSGGSVVATSPPHYALPVNPTTSPWLSLFTRGPWLPSHAPDEMLTPTTSVGECWPMQGSRGGVLIHLRERVRVTGLTLQHVSRGVVSDGGGARGAMPRGVRVRGVREGELWNATREVEEGDVDGDAGDVLGEFEYDKEGPQVQRWQVEGGGGEGGEGYEYVRLDILSNYGNDNYTCIYRVRVHGTPA